MAQVQSLGVPLIHEIVFINSYISAKIQRPIQRKILFWTKANLENVRLNALNLALDFMNSYDVDTAVEILWERFKSICQGRREGGFQGFLETL